MLLKTCVEDYLLFIVHERGLSKNTHKGYQAMLRHFLNWFVKAEGTDATTEDLTVSTCRRFLYYLSGKKLRPCTIHSYFDPVDGLCDFLVTNGALTGNPVKSLTLPKKDKPRRATISDDQIRLLFQACEKDRNPRIVALRRAVLSVLAFAGLRRMELCNLLVSDVNISDKSITVRSGKGGKGRTIYLCNDAVKAINDWLKVRWKDCKHPYLFVTDRKRRLHFTGLAGMIEDLKILAGLGNVDAILPHAIRHWSATHLLRAGADIRSVQAFLGHAQLATTSIYCHSDEARLRDVAHLTALQPVREQPEPVSTNQRPSEDRAERSRQRFRRVAR